MPEETVVAESSSAVETPVMDVSRGPLVDITPEQRAEFRKTGNLPEPPKKEEAAASSESKPVEAETKPAGDSEPPESKQDKQPKKQTAEERIAQLEATIEKIRKGKGLETPKAESSPAKPEPVQPAPTRPKPKAEDKKEDGTPKFETYEDFVEDLADWKAEQREETNKRVHEQTENARRIHGKVEEAKARYENFAEIVGPAVDAIVGDADISPVVKRMLDDSDVFPDLVFTIGSSKEELANFIKMAKESPGKAIRYIALTESLIAEELEGKAKPKAEPEPPAKPTTNAPKPPSEVGGRAASPGDELASAAKAGDFRAFKAEATRRQLAKLKTG